jgi:hypothetical protein
VVWAISKAAFPLALLKKFIKLAHLFFKMNNFHLLAAIVTGLNSGHVQTMKHVWSELPDSAKQLFEKFVAKEKKKTILDFYSDTKRSCRLCETFPTTELI